MSLSYGSPRDVTSMLDTILVTCREEPDNTWDNPEVQAAAVALAGLLADRVQDAHQLRDRLAGLRERYGRYVPT